MPDNQFIPRKTKTTGETTFESLRREGLALLQELSGSIWTDYNLHDPGVTILEQVCYALTELIYRAGFPVEDYLTDEDGKIDFERLALHPPERIFPCRPTTAGDYRKIICDATHGVGNVWLVKAQDPVHRGRYRMVVRLQEDVGPEAGVDTLAGMRSIYDSHRNLCEDLDDMTILPDVECDLHAEIEIAGGHAPADILARIYFECSKRIAADFNWTSFEDALKRQTTPEELFKGPLTTRGLIKDEETSSHPREIQNTDLIAIVKAVEGVESVRTIFLKTPHDQGTMSSAPEWPSSGYRLRLPQDGEECLVKLMKDGRRVPVRSDEVRARYKKLNFKRMGLHRTAQDVSALFPRPEGQYRSLRDYYSIQNQLPAVYGVNQYGIPVSAAPEVKAKAAQLKAYLLLFDQVMANCMANLQHLRTLFSSDYQPRRSYAYQVLENDVVPNIEGLYARPPADLLARILKDHDRHADRKGRLLDYLLALHGEKFSQRSLRHFNYYYTFQEVEEVIVANKIAFLENIVDITRDRGGGFNYRKPSWNTGNVSGLLRRVSLLLGFPHQMCRSLTMPILEQGFNLVSHERYAGMKAGTMELKLVDIGDLAAADQTFQAIPSTEEGRTVRLQKLRQDIRPIVPVRHNLLSETLLRGGLELARYRLGSFTAEENYQLVFQPQGEGQWWYLGVFPDRASGVQSAHSLHRFLQHLNIESEGLHVVEHLLLRPTGKQQHEQLHVPKGQDFYSFRLSVIFPDWTARCHNPDFRILAEETVRLNCPAHLYPECYWLSFQQMHDFELLYKRWLEVRCSGEGGTEALNVAARALTSFLLELHRLHKGARRA